MAHARRQVMVDAPVQRVWDLIGNVNRHPEWWPRVEAVQCDLLDVGCTYRQVTKTPGKTIETPMSIESLEDCQSLRVRCVDTGMYAEFLLAEAQSGTFVDAELSTEPQGPSKLVGGYFVRRWLHQSLEGLKRAASAAAVHE
jgi:Polyketide cyclase / dehydrase and lipid transport